MKKILLLLAIVAVTLTAEAQESFKFGNVTVDDFTHADYAVDTSMADAIVLDETVDALYYESGRHFAVNRSVKRKIKILKPSGVDCAEVIIPYNYDNPYTGANYNFNIIAYSYQLQDGVVKKSKLKKKDIRREFLNDSIAQVSFTIPNVEAGCIIEYAYTVFDYALITEVGAVIDYRFGHHIPIVRSVHQVMVEDRLDCQVVKAGNFPVKCEQREPEYSGINYGTTANRSFGINAYTQQSIIHYFEVNNVPAINGKMRQEDIPGVVSIIKSVNWKDLIPPKL